MDAAEKDGEGDGKKTPSVPNPRSPHRKRVLSIQSSSSSSADIDSIKKLKQEPLDCDACRSRQNSDDDLVPCYSLLQSNEICSYCFYKISSEDEHFYDCIRCKRSVHFVYVAKEIAGGVATAAEIETRDVACFDYVPPAPKLSEMGKEEEFAVQLFKEEMNERDEISKPKRIFTCTKCRHEVYFRDVVKVPKGPLQLDEKSLNCSDCDPEPIHAKSSSDKEKGFSIQKQEMKMEAPYKLRSREKAKASPIISSTANEEPRRSLRSSGKKAAEVPNCANAVPLPNRFFLSLTNCHVCGHEAKKLQVLKSEWRMLLVCGACLVSLGTDRICTYCFDPTSEKKDEDYTSCQKCLRAVHFGCIRNHPVYVGRAQLNADTYTCFDCEAIPNLWKNYSAAVVAAAASSRSKCFVNAAAAVAGGGGSNSDVNADEQQSYSKMERRPDP